MSSFYIFALLLLVIAIINLIRALREKNPRGKKFGIIINTAAILLLGIAFVIKLLSE